MFLQKKIDWPHNYVVLQNHTDPSHITSCSFNKLSCVRNQQSTNQMQVGDRGGFSHIQGIRTKITLPPEIIGNFTRNYAFE